MAKPTTEELFNALSDSERGFYYDHCANVLRGTFISNDTNKHMCTNTELDKDALYTRAIRLYAFVLELKEKEQ